MSINKLYKHQSVPGAKNNSFDAPVDRPVHNLSLPFNGFNKSHSPQLSQPSDDLERRRQEQFLQFHDEIKPVSENHDSSYEDGQTFVQSLTLSQSSNPEFFPRTDSRERTIGNIQITNLYESPRRLGARYGNEQEMEPSESRRLQCSFPRRAPGFPRVS